MLSVFERLYLFNVQEVFGFEGDGHALDGDVIAGAGVVANVCPHGKRHRFGLRAATARVSAGGFEKKKTKHRTRARPLTFAFSSVASACLSASFLRASGSSSRDTSESDGRLV